MVVRIIEREQMNSKINLISIALSLLILPISTKSVVAHHTREHSIVAHHNPAHNATFNISVDRSSTKVKAIVTDSAWPSISTEVPAGNVEFIVSNRGKLAHEMVILKIEEPIVGKASSLNETLCEQNENRLPLTGTQLDLAGSGTKVAKIESGELKNGATHKLMTKLTPGRYLLVSNISEDYQKGMKALLVVK
jgi:uncharacterized cupredoxin-like copper-binding protein